MLISSTIALAHIQESHNGGWGGGGWGGVGILQSVTLLVPILLGNTLLFKTSPNRCLSLFTLSRITFSLFCAVTAPERMDFKKNLFLTYLSKVIPFFLFSEHLYSYTYVAEANGKFKLRGR